MLMPHEGEGTQTSAVSIVGATFGPGAGQNLTNRYARRLALATPEGHYTYVVDTIAGYLTMQSPHRPSNQEDIQRTGIDEVVARCVKTAFEEGEAWMGCDSIPLPVDETGRSSQAVAAEIDPVNLGKPYVVAVPVESVLDYDLDASDGRATRVVFRRDITEKPNAISQPVTRKMIYEWTDWWWAEYEVVTEAEKNPRTGDVISTRTITKVVKSAAHDFGICPFARLAPKYPLTTIADLQRLLLNITSLNDEELFGATFSQKWVTGVDGSDVKPSNVGPTNIMFIKPFEARVGVFGADPAQAQSIASRAEDIREAIYRAASMDPPGKRAAESAAKKRYDYQGLYAILIAVTSEIEKFDNRISYALGILETDNLGQPVQAVEYSRDFEIASAPELIEMSKALSEVPFIPADIRRKFSQRLVSKLDPHSNDEVIAEQMKSTFDASPGIVAALVDLSREGMLTPKMYIERLGIPEEYREQVTAMLLDHATSKSASSLVSDAFNVPTRNQQDDDGRSSENNRAGQPGGNA